MDAIQHLLAYAVTAALYALTIRLAGGLERLWSAIDISDGISRYKQGLREIDDGGSSWLHAAGYGAITVILMGFAWHFDFSSSWDYSEKVRLAMAVTVGSVAVGRYVLMGVTFLPTLIEMFGAKFARLNDLWAQLLVIGLAGFDLFTDRERVKAFMEPYYPAFVNASNSWLMNIAFEGLYYYVYGIWWVLASYGFEAAAVCFAFATLGCVVKGMTGNQAARPQHRTSNKQRRQTAEDVI